MKKAVVEVDKQQLTSELETRIAALEARIEKLDPTPSLKTREPYPVGSQVYSVQDLEGRHPATVVGYRSGQIIVAFSPDEPERQLQIASVRPLEECPRAEGPPSYAHLDEKTREYMRGRRAAELAARTTRVAPPPPKQRRYHGEQDELPTWGMRPSIGQGE
jgi:hypothetical protein